MNDDWVRELTDGIVGALAVVIGFVSGVVAGLMLSWVLNS